MAEVEQQQAPPEPAPARTSRLTLGLVGLASVATLGAGLLLTAIAGAIHAPGAGQAYALAALAGVLVVVGALPVGLGGWILYKLRQRGIKIRIARTVAGLTLLWNAGILGIGLTVDKPWSVVELAYHARWVPMAALDRTPVDPASVDAVKDLVGRVGEVDSARELAPLLSNASAAGLAVKWLRIRDGQLTDDRVAQLYTLYGIDRDTLVDTPRALEDALVPRGRDLLYEVSEIVDLDAEPDLSWRSRGDAADVRVRARDARAAQVVLQPEGVQLDVVLEERAWRLHLADFADLVGESRAGSGEPSPEVQPVAEAPEPESEDVVAIRQAFLGAAAGRAGHLAGTTAFDAGWAASLTQEAAASTGLEVLAWCVGAPGEAPEPAPESEEAPPPPEPAPDVHASPGTDPIFVRDVEALRADYGLGPEDVALTEALHESVVPRGRDLLTRVLEICGPVKRRRQAVQARGGLTATDAQRMRWAELDAGDLSERAVIEDEGVGAKTVEVDGVTYSARLEDGQWRIDWP